MGSKGSSQGFYSTIWNRTTRLQNAPPFAIGFRSESSMCSRTALICSLIQRLRVQFTPIVRTRMSLGRRFSARGLRSVALVAVVPTLSNQKRSKRPATSTAPHPSPGTHGPA